MPFCEFDYCIVFLAAQVFCEPMLHQQDKARGQFFAFGMGSQHDGDYCLVKPNRFIESFGKSFHLSGQNWLQQEQWFDPSGRCWRNGKHPQPHWLPCNCDSFYFYQVTRLCDAAGWGEELARVEVETLEALVKGQAWHQAETNRSRLWSFVQILTNQNWLKIKLREHNPGSE